MDRCSSSRMARNTTSSGVCACNPATASHSPQMSTRFIVSLPVVKRRPQYRRTLLRLDFLLNLDLRNQNRGAARRYRHAAGFRSADSVENSTLVVGGDNLAEYGQRRADQIHTAYQFFLSVRIHAINHHREHVERVRDHAAGNGEPAFDVIEEQSERLILLLDLLNQ